MTMDVISKIEQEQYKEGLPRFSVGDTITVYVRVVEGDKERIQRFSGVVIGRRGGGLNASFTVRRISYGTGVERVFPLHSPRIDQITVDRKGKVRRAKLNYLRERKGKQALAVKAAPQAHDATDSKKKGKAKKAGKAKS